MEPQLNAEKPPIKYSILSVRFLAALMCAVLIMSATTAALLVTFHFSYNAGRQVGRMHSNGITSNTKREIERYLNRPASIVKGIQFTFQYGLRLLPKDMNQDMWYRHYWDTSVSIMRGSSFKYRLVGFAFEDDNVAFCRSQSITTFICHYKDIRQKSKSLTVSHIFNKSDFSKVGEIVRPIKFERRWYYDVERITWAVMWNSFVLRENPYMSVSAVLFNQTSVMIGVVAISFTLRELDTFVKYIVTTQNSVIILIDNYEMLLSSSSSIPLLLLYNISKEANISSKTHMQSNCFKSSSAIKYDIFTCRETLDSYPYPPLRDLRSSHSKIIDRGTDGESQFMTLDGAGYFISVAYIVTPKVDSMRWRIILFLSADDILGDIIEGRNLAVYISIAIIVVAVIVSFLFVTLLLHPLDTVAKGMYRVASMKDMDNVSSDGSVDTVAGFRAKKTKATTEPSLSVLSEIGTLQFAFNTMRTELAKIKSYLPQSVLAQMYGSDENFDEGDVVQELEGSRRSSDTSLLGHSGGFDLFNNVHDIQKGYIEDTRITNESLHGNKNKSMTLNTVLCLTHRRVTMMSLNIAGYHATLTGKDSSNILRIQSELVTAISSACSEHRGVIDGFLGDRFLVSFNAVTNVGNPVVQAARAAHTACGAAEMMRAPLIMTAGLISGTAFVGNTGSATIKRFTILGHVVSSAVILERLAKLHQPNGGVLSGGAAIIELEVFFNLLTVDAVVLPISTAGIGWRTRIVGVMSPKTAASDEWMYELQESSNNSRYSDANLGFEAFMDGDHSKTKRIVEKLSDGMHDPESMSVGETLKKLITAQPPVDGKRYANPMTDYYRQCVLSNGTTEAGEHMSQISRSVSNL